MGNPKKTAEVRVVLIEYHHIQTDASNFKSVVQSLTGKHSSTAEDGGEICRKRQRVVARNNNESIININQSVKMIHTASFKDLDRLLSLELPSMEDLDWILTD
ncbi:VQ motif-containing protein 1-like [Cucumis melo var. makuwa]|uniref:VQ motif-containing protein 1-like n=2 Tax=Cucumis melo TaxID=3656 RepID=A0A5D3CN21_CUCMM|nr:VQ motif-containing protein 1-like [Cucumis melo var. makuwa]TYK13287.1 VQ motif-containing protein 1-like [Cucumis melo var. makuwa]